MLNSFMGGGKQQISHSKSTFSGLHLGVVLWHYINILFPTTFHPVILASVDFLMEILPWELHKARSKLTLMNMNIDVSNSKEEYQHFFLLAFEIIGGGNKMGSSKFCQCLQVFQTNIKLTTSCLNVAVWKFAGSQGGSRLDGAGTKSWFVHKAKIILIIWK